MNPHAYYAIYLSVYNVMYIKVTFMFYLHFCQRFLRIIGGFLLNDRINKLKNKVLE